MKRVGVICLIAMLMFSFTGSECDLEIAKNNGVKGFDAGYSYLKFFTIQTKKQECSFIFSRGTEYLLTTGLSDGAASNLEIQLFDKSKKLICSNYNKKKGTFAKVLYPCTSTGVHYISYIDHSKNSSVCGAGVIGFKR
jgi:hypothetical protein